MRRRSRLPATHAVRITVRALVGAVTMVTAASAAPLSAQAPPASGPGVRLVAFTNEPREPELGEVFALNVTLRLAPGVVAFLPDTLVPAPDAASAGPGTWDVGLAPGDSVDVRATYPVIGLDPGGVLLPSLEVWTRPAETGEEAGPRALASLAGAGGPSGGGDLVATAGAERTVLTIGGALIMPFRAVTEAADGGLLPRPPADVLGRGWSLALVAAVALGAASVGLLLWLLVSGRASGAATRLAPRLPPREEALAELDRLRSLGWHSNGRVVDFYDATTGVLRHFADRTEAGCGTFLTSTELLGRLTDHWGRDRVARLSRAVWSAERVKFGHDRPEANAAESDWATVRGWIAELPEDSR